MASPAEHAPELATEAITIQLSPAHLERLDELCAQRNLFRSELIAELRDLAKAALARGGRTATIRLRTVGPGVARLNRPT